MEETKNTEIQVEETYSYHYEDHHTPLACAFHSRLEAFKYTDYYSLPFDSRIGSEFYNSKSACEKARKQCIETAYYTAKQHFTPSSALCIADDAVKFYSKRVESVFLPIIDHMEMLCKTTNQPTAFAKLKELVNGCKAELTKRFENELRKNASYYALYDIGYFIEKVPIEKHDFRVSEDVVFKLLETLIADNVQYTITDIYTSICEMEHDLNNHASTFFNTAYGEYTSYLSEIEALLDGIGHGFPPLQEDENANDYVHRIYNGQTS